MSTSSSPTAPIRVGVTGLGRAGEAIHLAALRDDPRYQITALCDPLAARREALAAPLNAQPFDSLEAMATSGLCDLIVIATPSQFHYRDAKIVLESGLDCVLEKPMAETGPLAQELVAFAKEKGKHLFVHHQYLFSEELLFLQEVIASGILGKIFHIEIFWTGFSRRWDWQTLRKNGGGQLLNTCPHLLTILLPLLGGDLEIQSANVRLIKDAGDTEDHVHASFLGRNGISASATVSSVCALPLPRLTLFGANGTLQEDFFEAKLRYYDPASVPAREAIDAAAPTDGSLQETLPWQEETRPVRPTQPGGTFYDHIAAVLRDGAPSRIDPNHAARIIEILETISCTGRV